MDIEYSLTSIETPVMNPNCVVNYDDIMVNLAFTSGERFLVLSMVLVLNSKEAAKELVAIDPIIKDLFITWLSKRGVMWYSNFENQNVLREELKEQISARLRLGKVNFIFFTKYIIQ